MANELNENKASENKQERKEGAPRQKHNYYYKKNFNKTEYRKESSNANQNLDKKQTIAEVNKTKHNKEKTDNSQKQQLDFPWNQENAPVEIKMKARLIPTWTVYNEMAGPQPFSFCGSAEGGEQEITLIPYGCTTLRISEFPVVGK